jgi:hypothetical protein
VSRSPGVALLKAHACCSCGSWVKLSCGFSCRVIMLCCSNFNDNQLTGNIPDIWSVGPAFENLADFQVRGGPSQGAAACLCGGKGAPGG